jgi:hypothetical protein
MEYTAHHKVNPWKAQEKGMHKSKQTRSMNTLCEQQGLAAGAFVNEYDGETEARTCRIWCKIIIIMSRQVRKWFKNHQFEARDCVFG